METVLRVEQLTVFRGTHAAVRDVSFSLEAGTDTAIVGPNGAGKSTLVRAILGIIPHQSGKVFILDRPIDRFGRLPVSIGQQIAYLPQNVRFSRGIPMTVAELVGLGWDKPGLNPYNFFRRNRLDRQQDIRQALARVRAEELLHHPLGSLSGGEMKKVLLAYCLVRPRKLLILDEAPAGLDVMGESGFYQLLDQLKLEFGWAILQVSHDLDMVSRYCDRVICLNRRLVCQGAPEVALTPENLMAAYGPNLTHYHHRHD